MNPARIADLLAPFLRSAALPNNCRPSPASTGEEPVIHSHNLQSISTYIDLLLRWNARINLTAIRDPEQIVTRHFGESLFAARYLFPRDAQKVAASSAQAEEARDQPPATNHRLADLGSGAGFPGLPIKLWVPDVAITLIESNQKKTAFLREVTRALRLSDINIAAARAQSLPAAAFDVVTLRAVERFEATLPIAAYLLAPGGRLALLIGSAQLDRARSSLPELAWRDPEPIPLSSSRILVTASSPR
jgi:16S rRNA (guanine527-N7)-methyltransferase